MRTLEAIVNVFRLFDWVTKEGWSCTPNKLSKEDATKEACSNNTANEISRRKLFKLIFQSLEHIKTGISLKLPMIIAALIMNVPPIMVVPLANVLRIQLLKYYDNEDLVLHIRQLMKVCVTNGNKG